MPEIFLFLPLVVLFFDYFLTYIHPPGYVIPSSGMSEFALPYP